MSGITLDGIAIEECLKCDKRDNPLSEHDERFTAWLNSALMPIPDDEVSYYREHNQRIAGCTFDEFANQYLTT